MRQEKSKPLLEDLKQWCDDNVTRTAKDSSIGKAIRYTINQWDSLVRYIEDGNLQVDNNAAERHIKPFVIGRKTGCLIRRHGVLMPLYCYTALCRRRWPTIWSRLIT
ncbi:hypothetical protein bplSymb_SCF09901P001 [Bathymodiolus platifrons methanotrophic gill symbiont]|nr:hypothetical protein bplSymb_SCF09901P001 [Bathymodiolus platifrons methanotrophic gill symbiont]